MVNMCLMMISLIHKHIMGKPSVRQYLNEENENVQDFIGNHVFFHDRLLEQWVKMCSFNFITKNHGLVCLHNYEAGLHDICATLDVRDYVDYILYRNMLNVHVIISKEKTSTSGYFDVYVYDGNFLKSWFDDKLHSTEHRVLALICNGRESKESKKMCINPMCHARVLKITNYPSHFNIINCLYDIDKFQYLNMTGSLIVNKEVERSKNPNHSWLDDVWHIFTFFLSIYRHIFTPPRTMFSPTFFPLEERVPNHDNAIIKHEKSSTYHQMVVFD